MKIITLNQCDSTNTVAKQIIDNQSIDDKFFMINTLDQLAGRGRNNKTWESEPAKNITCSIGIQRCNLQLTDVFLLSQMMSLTVLQILTALRVEDVKIKWPNDIVIGEKKIAGILIETIVKKQIIESIIIGVGVNVNQNVFANANAISLVQILHQETCLKSLNNKLFQNFLSFFEKLPNAKEQIRFEYLNHLYLKNEKHLFYLHNSQFIGTIRNVTDCGLIAIEKANGNVENFRINEIRISA